jgi:hypothetical protein
MGREEAVERLLAGYRRYYTITRFDGGREEEARGLHEAVHIQKPFFSGQAELSAVCEYYEAGEKYFLFHSAKLWSTAQEEFVFLFQVPRLTLTVFRELAHFAYEAGMDMAHIGPGHMYTYISPVFICDSMDEEAAKALMKCHYYNPSDSPSTDGWNSMQAHWSLAEAGFVSTGREGAWKRDFEKYLLIIRL